jgi:anti-anti-sigma factor
MTLRLTTTVQGEITTLAVSGQIDASNASEFRRAIAGALDQGTRLIIDLTAVDLLLSAGVSVLYDYIDQHPQLVIRADSIVARVLTIVGLDEALSIQTT